MSDAPIPLDINCMHDTFKDWLSEKGYLKATVRTYDSHVLSFLRFVASRCDREGRPPADWPILLDGYVSHLRMENATIATVNNHLTAVSMFFSALDLNVPPLRREKRLSVMPGVLTREERSLLIQACAKSCLKDRAVIFLFLYCGIRLGELIALNTDSVVIGDKSVSLMIETRLRRQINVPAGAADALIEWIEQRRSIVSPNGDRAVFVSQRGTRLNPSAIDAIVRKVGHRAGLVISATILRDTFFADLAESGADRTQMCAFSGTRRMVNRFQ